MRKIWIITLFPEIIDTYFQNGVISKSLVENGGSFELILINPSDFSAKGFKGVDSKPYGGGPGMVLRCDVIAKALEDRVFKQYKDHKKPLVIYTTPSGNQWSNSEAKSLACKLMEQDIVLICGRYEGIDQRIIDLYVDYEISVGNFVLSGGEVAVLSILDSALRFVPGVLGNPVSLLDDSFENGGIDGPKYTRPRVFGGLEVPSVLLSGNHREIEKYNSPLSKKE